MKHDWEYKKLGEVCESELGKTLNQSKDSGNLRPYLCAINIQWDTIDLSTIKQARFNDEEVERYSVEMGDLLICEGGDTGRAAIWNGTPILYQNAIHRVRFNSEVTARFALMCLRHLKNIGEIDSKYSKGVTIKHLVKSSLMSIPIPVPPLPIQQQIVSELDKVSEIIEKKKQQVKELDNLAQSIFYDMFGDPVENEKGWEVKFVKELGEVKIGPFGSLLHKSDYITGGIPLVNPIQMKGDRILTDSDFTVSKEKAEELSSYLLKKGDFVFARRGEIGRCAIVGAEEDGCICGTGSLFVRFKSTIDKLYLLYAVKSKSFSSYLIDQAKGATMLNINCGIVERLEIPTPPLPLQRSFAQKIEAIEKQKELINQSIKEAQMLFDARMDYWFGE